MLIAEINGRVCEYESGVMEREFAVFWNGSDDISAKIYEVLAGYYKIKSAKVQEKLKKETKCVNPTQTELKIAETEGEYT